jgi:hypothetical protein
MSDDPNQWPIWAEEYIRLIACSDRVTVRDSEDYDFGYRVFVDGNLILSRTKAENITRANMATDIDAALAMVRENDRARHIDQEGYLKQIEAALERGEAISLSRADIGKIWDRCFWSRCQQLAEKCGGTVGKDDPWGSYSFKARAHV